MKINVNCCDGIYNSLDIHFTGACDNRCRHCIDTRFNGLGVTKPDVEAIKATIKENRDGFDDVLFLGGEPCLYLPELLDCVRFVKKIGLEVFVTTSVPKVCFDNKDLFFKLIEEVDGINLSTQHYSEDVADEIRRTESKYDRQKFYTSLPHKEKIRINLNIVKPFLYTKQDISDCLRHYDRMGFGSIKVSEIQHGTDIFVAFADIFGITLPPAYSGGCQNYLDMNFILPGFSTPVLLKRSCFLCEESLSASLADGVKILIKALKSPKNKYGVIYGDGTLAGGWV